MMKAIRFHETGGPEVLRLDDVPLPELGPDEALIRVHAVGVNFADTERRRGMSVHPVPLPGGLGLEAAGVVTRVAPGADARLVGRRVAAMAADTYATYARAPIRDLAPLPDGVPFHVGAAIPVQGLTAYHLVHTVGRVRPGQTVLVHSAAGGVGGLAVQLAKAAGARVLATVSTDAKAAVARTLGADEVLSYDRIGGRDADLVLDGVGASTWKASLDALAPFGHLVCYGNASGLRSLLDVEDLYDKSIKVSSYWLLTPHPPELHRAALVSLVRDVAEGRLKVTLGLRLPLERAQEAHRLLETRATVGKVVLDVPTGEIRR